VNVGVFDCRVELDGHGYATRTKLGLPHRAGAHRLLFFNTLRRTCFTAKDSSLDFDDAQRADGLVAAERFSGAISHIREGTSSVRLAANGHGLLSEQDAVGDINEGLAVIASQFSKVLERCLLVD
jgi:hypothetical protein